MSRLLLCLLLAALAPPNLTAQAPGAPEPSPATAAEPEVVEAPAAARLRGAAAERELARRLSAIYGNLGELSDLRVEVGTGVVRLSGEAASFEAREQAAQIARRQPGVVAVDNRIRVRRGFAERLAPARQELVDSAYAFVAFLPLLLAGTLVLLVFWGLSRLAGRSTSPYRRLVSHPFGADLLRQVAQAAVLLVGVVLALQVMGATALVGAALGTAGLVGLAVGFAFRDLVENYIASVLLSLRRPFDPGDLVEVDGRQGKVIRLTSRATVLMTLDGNHLRLPNAQVFKGVILNYSRNPQRRLEVSITIGGDQDVRLAQHAGEAALRALPGVLAEPEPWAAMELAESGVLVRFYAWIDQRQTDWPKARSEAARAVKEALDRAGIGPPEPGYRLKVERAAAGAAPAPPPREAPDLSPDHHLDQSIAAERAREQDLLERSVATE